MAKIFESSKEFVEFAAGLPVSMSLTVNWTDPVEFRLPHLFYRMNQSGNWFIVSNTNYPSNSRSGSHNFQMSLGEVVEFVLLDQGETGITEVVSDEDISKFKISTWYDNPTAIYISVDTSKQLRPFGDRIVATTVGATYLEMDTSLFQTQSINYAEFWLMKEEPRLPSNGYVSPQKFDAEKDMFGSELRAIWSTGQTSIQLLNLFPAEAYVPVLFVRTSSGEFRYYVGFNWDGSQPKKITRYSRNVQLSIASALIVHPGDDEVGELMYGKVEAKANDYDPLLGRVGGETQSWILDVGSNGEFDIRRGDEISGRGQFNEVRQFSDQRILPGQLPSFGFICYADFTEYDSPDPNDHAIGIRSGNPGLDPTIGVRLRPNIGRSEEQEKVAVIYCRYLQDEDYADEIAIDVLVKAKISYSAI